MLFSNAKMLKNTINANYVKICDVIQVHNYTCDHNTHHEYILIQCLTSNNDITELICGKNIRHTNMGEEGEGEKS
jgi:hypothetical protein